MVFICHRCHNYIQLEIAVVHRCPLPTHQRIESIFHAKCAQEHLCEKCGNNPIQLSEKTTRYFIYSFAFRLLINAAIYNYLSPLQRIEYAIGNFSVMAGNLSTLFTTKQKDAMILSTIVSSIAFVILSGRIEIDPMLVLIGACVASYTSLSFFNAFSSFKPHEVMHFAFFATLMNSCATIGQEPKNPVEWLICNSIAGLFFRYFNQIPLT
jgi:hypothetical protein